MRKSDPQYNLYCKRRQKKLDRLKRRRSNTQHRQNSDSNKSGLKNGFRIYSSWIPEDFSIVSNANETIRYFNLLINKILRNTSIKRICFDFSQVTHMTADALMYLLAILKFLQSQVWEFSGNIPLQEAPKELFLQSGFLRRITRHRINVQPNGKFYMCIGNSADGVETKKVCEFLHRHSSAQRQTTNFIYDMLMELEVNTADHAYTSNANSMFKDNWLLVVEDKAERFGFTFLDVGVGICKTIYKRWHECLDLGKSQHEYLLSAFDGKLLRSETKQKHRGKGLPKIKKYSDEHRIENFTVITNRALCRATDGDGRTIKGERLIESLSGAVYYWEVKKASIICVKEAS